MRSIHLKAYWIVWLILNMVIEYELWKLLKPTTICVERLRWNIEKYRMLFPYVAAVIKLNISWVITNRGDSIQYIHTDSNHTDRFQRTIPAKLVSSGSYDKEKYLDMLLDSAEAVLSVFGFNRSLVGFSKKKNHHWWNELYQHRRERH